MGSNTGKVDELYEMKHESTVRATAEHAAIRPDNKPDALSCASDRELEAERQDSLI
jgi:hypothetical protein